MSFDALSRDVQSGLAVVAAQPQGIAVSSLMGRMTVDGGGKAPPGIEQCLATGWIEPSPIHVGWVRWARADGPFTEAAAHVRLRRNAVASLAEIHEMSGLPVTLHVLVGLAHAVVERYPGDDARSIVAETARYARPRSLESGITSRVLVAFLPQRARAAVVEGSPDPAVEEQLLSIRNVGYGYSSATPPISGGVLSAAVRVQGELPFGALCTFGTADTLTNACSNGMGRRMVEIARRLAEESVADAAVLRDRAVAAATLLGRSDGGGTTWSGSRRTGPKSRR